MNKIVQTPGCELDRHQSSSSDHFIDNPSCESLYEEWWPVTMLDISSPGKRYNQRVKDALLQLP